MIRLGIVGCNYGRTVHLPAFRADPRCEVVALAGTDPERTAALARAAQIPHAFGEWRQLIEHVALDAITIATPPRVQPTIAAAAIARGLAVFAEKPLATNINDAAEIVRLAQDSGRPTMMDFNFSEIAAWRKARELLMGGAIGPLRHAIVTWNVENYSTRMRIKNWKTSGQDGGGALGNFISQSFHYLEWFFGPIAGLAARTAALPADPEMETTVVLTLAFRSGAAGSLAMSCASYLGSGHRLEFYGEDGALVLVNSTTDYMRGFTLSHGRRPATTLTPIAVDDPLDADFPADGRIAPVARLAKRFLDAIERGETGVKPGFAEGLRVQHLLDAARRSDAEGRWIDVPAGVEP